MPFLNLNLTQRLSLVFSILLLACCSASAWLQVRASDLHEMEVIQDLSRDLAAHIAHNTALIDANGLRPEAVRKLFGQLMVVNPSVEVYLLDNHGHIEGNDAPPGHLKRQSVDLAPVHELLAGHTLPVLGDDPRSVAGRKVFSAAPLRTADGATSGFIYVVLQGEAHDALSARVSASAVLRTTLWSMALVALLGLLAGLTAFALITRPLRRLTDAMRHFDVDGAPDAQPRWPHAEPAPRASSASARDEMAMLENTFGQMADRIGDQWRTLTRQDQERRELVANISHDLRTPLTSLHGYLETLALKADTLSDAERHRYLAIALAQSDKVGRLAQALFELARLEHGLVQPALETFSLVDLVQDVFQKFELPAEARRLQLRAAISPRLPPVSADLGMIERVLTNLLDNAIRHTPAGGYIEIVLAHETTDAPDGRVSVTVSDTGPGIPPAQRDSLFRRPFRVESTAGAAGGAAGTGPGGTYRGGGLGLLIVQRMLQLHHSQIRLVERAGLGASFRFELPAAPVDRAARSSPF